MLLNPCRVYGSYDQVRNTSVISQTRHEIPIVGERITIDLNYGLGLRTWTMDLEQWLRAAISTKKDIYY